MKLRCENLKKKYGVRMVVKGVSMEVNQGEIVGFLGPNGAGKTTSFYMITGQVVPYDGHIYLDDEEITKLPMYKRSQKGVGYLPQEASVFRKMSVQDNIMSVMELTDMTKAERTERLESLIDEFNLSKVRRSLGIQLSGGERRRCEIARALATDPKFILLDEPFAGVDPIAVEDIQYIIAKLKYRNIGVIITDHNVAETLAITDRAYLLYEGSILRHGTPRELADNEEVRIKYLGATFILKPSASVKRARMEENIKRQDAGLPFVEGTPPEEIGELEGYRIKLEEMKKNAPNSTEDDGTSYKKKGFLGILGKKKRKKDTTPLSDAEGASPVPGDIPSPSPDLPIEEEPFDGTSPEANTPTAQVPAEEPTTTPERAPESGQ